MTHCPFSSLFDEILEKKTKYPGRDPCILYLERKKQTLHDDEITEVTMAHGSILMRRRIGWIMMKVMMRMMKI